MNILISAIYGHNSYSRGIMPDVLQTQIENHPDARIFYLTNSNSFKVCYFNINKSPEVCYRCKTGIQNTLKLVEGRFTHIRIADVISKSDKNSAKSFFKNNKKIDSSLSFENFEVGSATLSTYISRTRDRDLINVDQPFVEELAFNALSLYQGIKRFIAENNIDVVYNFNGRHEYVRAVFRAALVNGITCYNVERARIGGYLVFYENSLPHNIRIRKRMVEENWAESKLSYNEKREIAESFFRRQRNGESVIYRSYTAIQQKSHLPKSIFNGNENVVLFNSSDDEYAALGKEFENPLFPDQISGIEFLVDYFGKELIQKNLIIRMHPNLSGLTYNYVEKIKKQHQRYPNIFVVEPKDKTDSYALLNIAEKVITFGSTLGLEANYWEKPVILLAKSYHYFSNVAYTPKDLVEVQTLLSIPLIPKPKEESLKFGFYYLTCGVKARHYYEQEIGKAIYFKGKQVHFFSFSQRLIAKVIGSAHKHLGVRLPF